MGKSWNRGWMVECRDCEHKRVSTETTTGYHGGAVPVTTKYCVAPSRDVCPISGWPEGRWEASKAGDIEVEGPG